MRRRYKRTRLRWKPILWLFLLINLGVAAFNSRVTSVRHVEVVGARVDDSGRIEEILAQLRGIPFSKIHWRDLETAVLREPSVRRANFTRNAWGGGTLKMQYRQPVARMARNGFLGLDAEGVVFSARNIPQDLPTLELPDAGPPTLMTLAGSWDAQRLAELAVKIRAIAPPGGVGIQVDDRGEVCLNMNSGRVVLGSCDDLDKKLDVLQKRLLANPTELSEVQRLILTKPDAPAVVPLPKREDRSR